MVSLSLLSQWHTRSPVNAFCDIGRTQQTFQSTAFSPSYRPAHQSTAPEIQQLRDKHVYAQQVRTPKHALVLRLLSGSCAMHTVESDVTGSSSMSALYYTMPGSSWLCTWRAVPPSVSDRCTAVHSNEQA